MKKVISGFTRIGLDEFLRSPRHFDTFVQDLKGGLVAAIPTDTLYGFAVDGDSQTGIKKVYSIKSREEEKPLILFLDSLSALKALKIFPGTAILELLEKCWPGPLTAVFPRPSTLFPAFGHKTIGIRVPDHPELLSVLKRYPGYLLTTSANRSGEPPLFSPGKIEEQFSSEISWILDGGIIPLSDPSTVADMSKWPPKILRQGKIHF